MLETEDIKKLTEYQVEVFKDVFATKEDLKKTDAKIGQIQSTLDAVLKDKKDRDAEIVTLNHRMKNAEDFLDKTAPKLNIEYRH